MCLDFLRCMARKLPIIKHMVSISSAKLYCKMCPRKRLFQACHCCTAHQAIYKLYIKMVIQCLETVTLVEPTVRPKGQSLQNSLQSEPKGSHSSIAYSQCQGAVTPVYCTACIGQVVKEQYQSQTILKRCLTD